MVSIFRGTLVWNLGLAAGWIWLAGFSATQGWAFPLEVAESPGSNLNLTVKAIRSAKNTLNINIYEFTSSEVKDAILDRIRAGVQVQILEEGQPVGGFSAAAKEIFSEVSDAMHGQNAANRYLLMSSKNHSVKRRFRFDHGKYIVIDGKMLLIGSENYSPGGQPLPGSKGNRGWEVLLSYPEMAYEYDQLFAQDTDPAHEDLADSFAPPVEDTGDDLMSLFAAPQAWAQSSIQDWKSTIEEGFDPSLQLSAADLPKQSEPGLFITRLDAGSAEKVTSPESSLSGLLSLIGSAKTHLDIEVMTFDYNWGGPDAKSPLFAAVVEAAQRGVKVRVLMNDERAFSSSAKQKNLITANAFNSLAKKQKLSLTAAVANLKAMKVKIIHNKGALVDGDTTLISSINWNKNSVTNNRETAVILKSEQVYEHYHQLFEQDWAASQ